MLTVEQLRKPMTAKQFLAVHLLHLGNVGFHIGSWIAGSIQKTFLSAFSRAGSDLTELPRTLTEYSLSEYSSGDPLADVSANVFDNDAVDALETVGSMTLTNASTNPYTIEPGGVLVGTVTGVKFGNTTGGTLAANNTLPCTFQALKKGAAGNIPNGTPLIMHTALAGVTADNGTTLPGETPWYTTAGRDPEPTTTLRQRNRTKWATFGIDMIADGFINLALSVDGIVKASVDDDNPRGAGTIDVYVAGPQGIGADPTVTDATKNEAQALFARRVMKTVTTIGDEDFATSRVQVLNAPEQTLNVGGVIYYNPNYTQATVQTAVETALDAYVAALDVGGEDIEPLGSNLVPLDDIYETIKSAVGVTAVNLTAPTANVSVGPTALVVRPSAWGLTYTAVTS